MTCHDVAPFIARRADQAEAQPSEALEVRTRAAVDGHLAVCASCRAALDTQRLVAQVLRQRPADKLSPHFTARLAARLDDASGWFGVADWRAWTLRLTPVAAALALAMYLGVGVSTQTPATIEEWTVGSERSSESLLWESGVSPESVMETMLTGEMPANTGDVNNVR